MFKYLKISGTVVLLVFSLACHRKTIPAQPSAPSDGTENPAPVPEKTPEKRVRVLASLRKTPCYGYCPVFECKIFSDGHGEYFGEANVTRLGRFSAEIPSNWLKILLETADSANFLAFEKKYPKTEIEIPDLPMTFLYFELKGRMKTVENQFDAPPELSALERFFEEKIEELNWKPMN